VDVVVAATEWNRSGYVDVNDHVNDHGHEVTGSRG
jgi:hypothetical protein